MAILLLLRRTATPETGTASGSDSIMITPEADNVDVHHWVKSGISIQAFRRNELSGILPGKECLNKSSFQNPDFEMILKPKILTHTPEQR